VSDAEICGVELGFNLLLAFALGSSKRAQSKKTVTDMKTFKLINTGKSYSLGLSSVIVLALIISIFQFVTFSEASPGAPNPGHSVSEIGSGVFGEEGVYAFPGASTVSIGTTSPSYKLDVRGTGRFTNPVTIATPTSGPHAATKDYVDGAVVSTCNLVYFNDAPPEEKCPVGYYTWDAVASGPTGYMMCCLVSNPF